MRRASIFLLIPFLGVLQCSVSQSLLGSESSLSTDAIDPTRMRREGRGETEPEQKAEPEAEVEDIFELGTQRTRDDLCGRFNIDDCFNTTVISAHALSCFSPCS